MSRQSQLGLLPRVVVELLEEEVVVKESSLAAEEGSTQIPVLHPPQASSARVRGKDEDDDNGDEIKGDDDDDDDDFMVRFRKERCRPRKDTLVLLLRTEMDYGCWLLENFLEPKGTQRYEILLDLKIRKPFGPNRYANLLNLFPPNLVPT